MEIPVFFNSNAVIKGDLLFASDLHLNCEIIGNVESEKKIVIGPDGFFKGRLIARELVVFGKLEGEIIIFGPTILHPGSALSGTLSTQVIEIIDCAYLNIRINILNGEEAANNIEAPSKKATEIFLKEKRVTTRPVSVSSLIGAEDSEVLLKDNNLQEPVEKCQISAEQPQNFLFTHFSETNLTHDSRYNKGFFEVQNDQNSSN